MAVLSPQETTAALNEFVSEKHLGILTLVTGLNIYLASAHQITSVLLAFSALNLYYFRAK